MANKNIQPVPGSGFDTHLLSMEETWWARDHPFNARVVRVKRQVERVARLEAELDAAREELDAVVAVMNEERKNA
jgi:hypothetical protein